MSYEKKNRRFVAKPVYEGGEKALQQYLREHVKYPNLPMEERVSGIVELKVDINSKGRVTSSTVIKSLGKLFDKEAKRVASLLRFSVPGTGSRSGKVIFHRPIKVRFTEPKPAKKPSMQTGSLSYRITKAPATTTSGTTSKPAKPSTGSYSYSITIG